MRILVAGDIHGRYHWVKELVRQALENDCPILVQLGDFGIWPGASGQLFLNETEKLLAKHDLTLFFVDGNHEDFPQLYGYPIRDDGFRKVRPHIIHAPRGHRWEWDGIKVLALGGAHSIDKEYRVEGISWWPEEEITKADIVHAIDDGSLVDIMVTHDCPTGVNPLPPNPIGVYPAAYANRQRLTAVVDVVKPKLLWHGHYHYRTSNILIGPDFTTRVEGLANDGCGSDAWLVFDTSNPGWIDTKKEGECPTQICA